MSLTLVDFITRTGEQRLMSRADLIEVAESLGGKQVKWCSFHDAEITNTRDGLCWDSERVFVCRPIEVVVLPVEEGL